MWQIRQEAIRFAARFRTMMTLREGYEGERPFRAGSLSPARTDQVLSSPKPDGYLVDPGPIGRCVRKRLAGAIGRYRRLARPP
ncbi:hypothetical protein HNR20_005403 [Micromonospora parathelypteridis]|uniref:Uncharacterized protein n=1 Tax=Micromonospora parathelypteridis TaxID=1839617 RepID=A0A840W770_9ACTN|nr:hypothetical protein [Micromonospora parathelypteridis]